MPGGLMNAVPFRRRPQVSGHPGVLMAALAWPLVGTLAYVRHCLQQPERTLEAGLLPEYLTAVSCYLPWIALTPLVFRLERRLPLGRAGWARHLAALAALSLPVAYVASLASLVPHAGVQALFGLPLEVWSPLWAVPARELLGHEFLYWSSVGAGWMLRALLEARENERRAARLMLEKSQLETSLRQAELDVLRMRLDPHFLFNSLQNISVLALHDPRTASRMLTKLGDLLRASLRRDGRMETPLRAEIDLACAYLAIERMRFGDRLSSLVDLAPGTEDALVPSLLLQPLVENAIRHGLRNVDHPGLITIRSRVHGEALVLTVTDNGAGPPAAPRPGRGIGIGLGATCERLARMYPGRHDFLMREAAGGGTEVRITLPLSGGAVETHSHAHAATADRR